MRVTIETNRLILRNVTPEDYLACFKWCGDSEVNKYLIYPCYKCAEDVKVWLENRTCADDPDNYDLGFVLKETGELIGMVYERDSHYDKTDGSVGFDSLVYKIDYRIL